MPSPFPGMDPFIEGQVWEDFHTRLIADLSDALVQEVRPRYVVRIEERVCIENKTFLTIRERGSMDVVTIIELLSPANKRAASDGRREYLHKRDAVLRTGVHLVQLDLLRGGERLPTVEPLPLADYYAFVCRGDDRPHAEIYPWSLRQSLPVIPVPLANNEPDASLDLRSIFDRLYDRAGYDYSLDYQHGVAPAFSAAEADWATQILHPSPHTTPPAGSA